MLYFIFLCHRIDIICIVLILVLFVSVSRFVGFVPFSFSHLFHLSCIMVVRLSHILIHCLLVAYYVCLFLYMLENAFFFSFCVPFFSVLLVHVDVLLALFTHV